MNENIMQAVNENAQKLMTPIHEFSKTAISNFAKITEIQFSTAKYLADMGINQLKAATEIGDLESAQEFTKKSLETVSEANRKLLECGSKIIELSTEFKEDFGKIISHRQEEAKSMQEKKSAKYS